MGERESSRAEVTRILLATHAGDSAAVEQLVPLVYNELLSLVDRFFNPECPDHTIRPTDLVNEAYQRLVAQEQVPSQMKLHFVAVGAQAMRRILVDRARSVLRKKCGERPPRVELTGHLRLSIEREEDVLALDEALKKLKKLDTGQARIVELRFFGGLSVREVAELMDLPKRTAELEWAMIRAWLRREID